MKKTNKVIATILSLLVLMGVFSVATPVFAAEVDKINTENSNQTIEKEEEKYEAEVMPEILGEDKSLRTEKAKYFRQTDGSYLAAQYAYPVHYEEDGIWKDINLTLEKENLSLTEAQYVASNTSTPFSFPVEFKKNEKKEVSVIVEGYELKFSPIIETNRIFGIRGNIVEHNKLESTKIGGNICANGTKNKVESTRELKKTEDFLLEKSKNPLCIKNQSSSIVYENVYPKVNIEYEISTSKLKESIVLKEKQNKNIFEFNLDIGELYPVAENDGSISLFKNKNMKDLIAAIAPPFMLDSEGNYCDNVTMSIRKEAQNNILTIVADKEWLEEKGRAYPVIIDPTIMLDVGRQHTIDCYIDDSQPTTAFPYDYYLYIGNNSLGKTRAFMKFDLPDLPDDCSVVTGASLHMWQIESDVGSKKGYLKLYPVTENWNNSDNDKKPKWNNQPSHESTAIDYDEIVFGVGKRYDFDITKSVKNWYEGMNNYGLMIATSDENSTNKVRLLSAENTAANAYPVIQVTYRNNKGIEPYWNYSEYSAGRAGTAYVNNYSGNLVYAIPLISSPGERMPLSLSLVYNSYCAGETYVCGKNGSSSTTSGKGWRFNIQETVLPSSQYGLTGESASNYPYVHTDSDGTEHYFKKEKDKSGNTIYVDEDNSKLKLILDGECTYIIKDELGNGLYFNAKGNLWKKQDTNGNYIYIKYKEPALSGVYDLKEHIEYIEDGSGHRYTFIYYGETDGYTTELNFPKKIKDEAGREIILNISNCYLRSIKHYDGTEVKLFYENEQEGIINYIHSVDGNGLNFDYTSKANGRKVNKVKEIADSPIDNTIHYGKVETFDRTKYNVTVKRSPGIDAINYSENTGNGNDDIITKIQFDNWGRAVSEQVSYGNGKEVGAGSCGFKSPTGTNTNNNRNKVKTTSTIGKNTGNLIKNSNAESMRGWYDNSFGNLSSIRDVSSAEHYVGQNSMLIKNADVNNATGNSYFGQAITGLKVGKTYTFSAYVKATFNEIVNENKGAFVQLSACDSAGNIIKSTMSQRIKRNTSSTVNKGWTRISTTMEIPTSTTVVRAYLCLNTPASEAYFDCIQFEEGNVPDRVNLIENSSFEDKNSNGLPTNWIPINIAYNVNSTGIVLDGITTTYVRNGSKSLRINGEMGNYKGMYQTIPLDGNDEETYVVSGWGAANAANSTFHKLPNEQDDKSLFEIAVRVKYEYTENGTKKTVYQYKESAKFNTTISGWQYTITPIVLKYKKAASDNKTYKPIELAIMPRYNYQINSAFFDHIQLVKESAQSYDYDKDGKLISCVANPEQKANLKYDNNDLVSYTDNLGNKTTLTYDSNHNVLSSTTPNGIKTNYTYNNYGEETETIITAGNKQIKAKKSYSPATSKTKENAYLSSVTDENNVTINYTYDDATGAILKFKNPVNETTKTYDTSFSKPHTVEVKGIQNTSEKSKVEYTHRSNKLNSLLFGYPTSNKQETFSFEYDHFGNVVRTKVGNTVLCNNVYGEKNGLLKEVHYGNSDGVKYTYDYLGNVVGQKFKIDGNWHPYNAYLWTYSLDGTPRTYQDGPNKLEFKYSYDSVGRLVRQDIYDNNETIYKGYTENGYDQRGNLTTVNNMFGDNMYSQRYYFSNTGVTGSANAAKDNLSTRYRALGENVDYSYDALDRITKKSLSIGPENNRTPINREYTYKSSSYGPNYTTHRLATEKIVNDIYAYDYDDLGNIVKILKNSNCQNLYTYDSNAQLRYESVEEKTENKWSGNTNEWVYDDMGNILSKKIYSVKKSEIKSNTIPTKIINYHYSQNSTSWKNLLTGIDFNSNGVVDGNESIVYDNIGNPTRYLGANMTWLGRNLTGFSKGNKNISCTYDARGLRGSKTVNGDKTVYYYVGDKLAYEERADGKKLYFFYDSFGHLAMIYYHYIDESNTNQKHIYYTLTNQMGDVLEIYHSSGNKVAEYEYDAWGNITSIRKATGTVITDPNHIAIVNPIRYRGYFYDTDLELYYLQSRYYNPKVGRFLNADGTFNGNGDVLGYNMFAYCGNNPIKNFDPNGNFAISTLGLIVMGAFALGGMIIGLTSNHRYAKVAQKKKEGMYKKPVSHSNNTILANKKTDYTSNTVTEKKTESSKLSAKDRAINALIGGSLGLAVGGAIVIMSGATLAIGGTFTTSALITKEGIKAVAYGVIGFDITAFFSPLYGVEIEPISWDETTYEKYRNRGSVL